MKYIKFLILPILFILLALGVYASTVGVSLQTPVNNTQTIKVAQPFSCNAASSPDNYIAIWNCQDLQEMNINLNANYALMNNINCNETYRWNWNGSQYMGFDPVGSSTIPFTGSFTGQGYNITNLYIYHTTEQTGLFGVTINATSIRDVGLINVNITGTAASGTNYVGALVGWAKASLSSSNISQCFSTGTVTSISSPNAYAGGLIGRVMASGAGSFVYLQESYSTVNVTCTGSYCGGLVGLFAASSSGVVAGNDLYARGNVVAVGYAGGLFGASLGTTGVQTLMNAYATGKVNTTSYAGGIDGYQSGLVINNTFATGDVWGNGGGTSAVGPITGVAGTTGPSNWWFYNNSICNDSFPQTCNTRYDGNYSNITSFYSSSNAPMSSWDFVNTWSVSPSTSICYQEQANVSTSCGGLATGNYTSGGTDWSNVGFVWDANWTTAGTGGGDNYYATIIYSKPSHAKSAIWQYKGAVIGNITIPAQCLSGTTLQLFLNEEDRGPGSRIYAYCYNSSANIDMGEVGVSTFYEEAVYWLLANNYPVLIMNYTSVNITFASTVTLNIWNSTGSLVNSTPLSNVNYCYQETANISTAADGNCGLNYTGGAYYVASGVPLLINYTKPVLALNSSYWQTGTTYGVFNKTLPALCWNQQPLQLRASMSGAFTVIFECWNSTSWQNVYTNTSTSGGGSAGDSNYFYLYDANWVSGCGYGMWTCKSSAPYTHSILEESMQWAYYTNTWNSPIITLPYSDAYQWNCQANNTDAVVANHFANYTLNLTRVYPYILQMNAQGSINYTSGPVPQVCGWYNYSSCYQETANVSTICGGLSTGRYGFAANNFSINYTKPAGVSNNSLWMVKHGVNTAGAPYNISIPAACWAQSPLQFKIYSRDTTPWAFSQPYCYNGTDWQPIGTTADAGSAGSGGWDSGPTTDDLWDGNWGTTDFYRMDALNWYKKNTYTVEAQRFAAIYEEAMWWMYNSDVAGYNTCGLSKEKTPTIRFNTSQAGDCKYSNTTLSYNSLAAGTKCATTGSTSHVCTLSTAINSQGIVPLYIACYQPDSNLYTDYSTDIRAQFNYSIDTLPPLLILNIPPTSPNASEIKSQNWINVNATVSDPAIDKFSIYISYNNTALLGFFSSPTYALRNTSIQTFGGVNFNSTMAINLTNMPDGRYSVYANATDLVGNQNISTAYQFYLDTQIPNVTFDSETTPAGAYNWSLNNSIFVSMNASGSFLNTSVYKLYDSAGSLVSTGNVPSSKLCYQQSATTPNKGFPNLNLDTAGCMLNYNGSYTSAGTWSGSCSTANVLCAYDGDWNTFGNAPGLYFSSQLYATYKKPNHTINSVSMFTKDSVGNSPIQFLNFSLQNMTDCLSSPTNISFYILRYEQSVSPYYHVEWYCKNMSNQSQYLIFMNHSSGVTNTLARVYEFGLVWNISTKAVNVSIPYNGIYYLNITGSDMAGNTNTTGPYIYNFTDGPLPPVGGCTYSTGTTLTGQSLACGSAPLIVNTNSILSLISSTIVANRTIIENGSKIVMDTSSKIYSGG